MNFDKISFGNNKTFNTENLKNGILAKKVENPNLKSIFSKFDKNSNGILEKNEIDTLIENIKSAAGDNNLSTKESKKLLKNFQLNELTEEDLNEFLEYIQQESENIDSAQETENGISITYKKDADGNIKTENYTYNSGDIATLTSSTTTNSDKTYSLTTIYDNKGENISGFIETKGSKGAQITTSYDKNKKPLKSETQKNGGIITKTYEYKNETAENPTKITTKNPDGSEIIEENGFKTTISTDGTTTVENGNTTTKTLTSGRIITTTTNNENDKTVTLQKNKNSKPITLQYDNNGNILTSAKSGENFEDTAIRLGIIPNTPEFAKFQHLNEDATKKGYFQVGGEVVIPKGMEETINIDELNVNVKEEINKFKKSQIDNIDISQYEGRTITDKLEINTTYWELAKYSLDEEGIENPTNAEISKRSLELQKLNGGKPLTKGTEVTIITNIEDAKEANSPDTENRIKTSKPITAKELCNIKESFDKLGFNDFMKAYNKDYILQTFSSEEYNIEQISNDLNYISDKNGNNLLYISFDEYNNPIKIIDAKNKDNRFYLDSKNNWVLQNDGIQEISSYIGKPEKRIDKDGTSYDYLDNGLMKKSSDLKGNEIYTKDGNLLYTLEPDKVNKYTKVRKYPLVEELRADINAKTALGLPTTGENFADHIAEITPYNVMEILEHYPKGQYVGQNTYYVDKESTSLIQDILTEWGLSKDDRIKYIKHIKDCVIENAKQNGIYTQDLSDNFDKEVEAQMSKIGFAEDKSLSIYLQKLDSRKTYINTTDKINLPNGKIDQDFKQGGVGDCWAISAIKSIANTPKGLEILNSSLKVMNDGSVEVTLKGVGRTYTITKEELTNQSYFSTGDADVRALEIAMDKYITEANIQGNEDAVYSRIDMDGNLSSTAYKILLGTEGNIIENIDDNVIDTFIDNPNHGGVASSISPEFDDSDSKTFQTEFQDIKLYYGHAYSIQKADSQNVYLINPWDTSQIITVPRDIFKKFFNTIEEFNL